jgi:uncharacterized protein YbaR (Trm112 family)
MSLDRRLLDLLCCPVNKMPLVLADKAAMASLQEAAAAGRLLQRDGVAVVAAPTAALLEARSGWCYPIVDDIPVLLPEAALRINGQSEAQVDA